MSSRSVTDLLVSDANLSTYRKAIGWHFPSAVLFSVYNC